MKIGLSSCGKDCGEALFRAYAEAGIACMEISYGKEKTDALDYRMIRQFASFHGVELHSLHLPFMPFDEIDISVPELYESTLAYYRRVLTKAAEQAGISRFVVHPSGEPIAGRDRAVRLETAKKGLYELAQTAKQAGAVVCVENLPRTCLGRDSGEILYLTEGDDALRVCFDTNHLLSEPSSDFIGKTAHKIETTHVSDYDRIDEKHWLPGEGETDWQALYRGLLAQGYDGAWLYEVGFSTQPSRPQRKRELTCSDFARNAREIFENREITVITV